MSDKWKRFEEGPQGPAWRETDKAEDGRYWVVKWDNDPKFYFTPYPNTWGGSGWYADPQDVISKPEANSNVRKEQKRYEQIAAKMTAAEKLLEEVKQCCLFSDDDGRIGVTEDAVIPSDLFDRICEALNNEKH